MLDPWNMLVCLWRDVSQKSHRVKLRYFCFLVTRWTSDSFHHLVYPPFASNTAPTRRGMLSISLVHSWVEIPSHSASTRAHSSSMLVGSFLYAASRCLRCCHRCSIGFRSGDCAGHSSTETPWAASHSRARREVCLGSLSCWKM